MQSTSVVSLRRNNNSINKDFRVSFSPPFSTSFPFICHLPIKPFSFCSPSNYKTGSKLTPSLIVLSPTCSYGSYKDQPHYLTKASSRSRPCYCHSISNLSHFFFDHLHLDSYPGIRNQQERQDRRVQFKTGRGLFTNMWWVDLKAAVGQRINLEGIVSSASVFVKDRHLALPHVSVPDVRYIDWAELRKRGFRGVVFDKDNTITVPYSLKLWGPLESSIERCKSVFENEVAVFSNSSGLYEYDYDGSKARALEKAIGIKVLRHRVKKPAGTAEEMEKHFGCKSWQLVIVGDRPFTDIVYGNRNGLLTILTEPLSLAEEPFVVRQVRKLEMFLINCWLRRGLKPADHSLLPDVTSSVKDPLQFDKI
ncbi:hypothetical protein K2173_023216 [Erythroxylum novogranatense]|uniref:Haloacid dehalogenase superfamily protein n=1 Tax=Erythroxylum novogranatense TaxID=1862640 RepID=A0AAV8T891_9ROSI|nr:hypothetical protein K2173_023216 [Erythroxylum novogranatense]